jgi:hypothetical protein
MRNLLLVVLVALLAAPAAFADCSFNYGWEDGGTVLSVYPTPDGVIPSNVGSPVHSGAASLQLVDNLTSGTPEGLICWIVGLTDGDMVTASIWRYDTTPSSSPSCRIWGKYTPVGGDVDSYAGSASGNDDYGPGTGWDQTSYTWTFDSDGGSRDGLMIAVRTYSNPGDTVWVDDLEVFIDSDTFCGQIYLPCDFSAVEDQTWSGIKALYR